MEKYGGPESLSFIDMTVFVIFFLKFLNVFPTKLSEGKKLKFDVSVQPVGYGVKTLVVALCSALFVRIISFILKIVTVPV